MFVSEALAVIHVLRAIGSCCGAVYRVATDHCADIKELAQLGMDICADRQLFMLNKKHALELIQTADLIEADLRGFREKEERRQLNSAMQAHLKDVLNALKKARSTVKSVIMPADVAKSTMRKVAWIGECVMNRSTLQQSLVETTAALVRSCQLLGFAVQLRADSMRHDADDGGAGDAAEICKLMERDKLHMSDELQGILEQLQQSSVQQADRVIAAVQEVGNHQRSEQKEGIAELRAEVRMMRREAQTAYPTALRC